MTHTAACLCHQPTRLQTAARRKQKVPAQSQSTHVGLNTQVHKDTHSLETRCGVLGALTLPMRTGGTSTELQGRCYDN